MQSATPSSSAPPYTGGAGAGGKFRKPPVSKKRPSTPYDRPLLPTHNSTVESQDGGGGWLSKLVVNPARRLIVGGATRILPSFFSNSDSSSADEEDDDPPSDRDNQDVDATVNACGDAKHALELGVSRWSGDAGPSNKMDTSKGKLDNTNVKQDQSTNLGGDLDLAKIENMLKGKQFSRDESKRLMEILNSRLADVSNAEVEKEAPSPQRQANEDVLDHKIPSKLMQYNTERALLETPKPRLQSNIQDEVAASPIDIAKAYMGSRTSELGFNSHSIVLKDRMDPHHHNLFPSKPHILTPASKSSTCWPGAMVQDQRGYLTPQSQKGRYGLHNFPRTPYSRTLYSRTKPNLTQIQADSRPTNASLTTFQQSRTPNYGQMKTGSDAMDGGYGSVGPIRRVRNKFSSEPRSQGPINPYSFQTTSSPSASRTFLPVFQNNPENIGSSSNSVDKNEPAFKKLPLTPGPSNETVRKILEQLDRHKPTPKEKADELKLATEWKRPNSQDNNTLIAKESNVLAALKGQTDAGESFKGMPHLTKTLVDDAGAGPSFGLRSIDVASESKQKPPVTNNKEKETTQPWQPNQINGQDLTRKRPSQPILKPISFNRPDPQQVISSDNTRGFTFPFSGTASSATEPPTPSIMPSFPATRVATAAPTYNFGTKKSGERLVFSFPSTSNAPVDDGASGIKFSFGSDKKRVSFGSIGNDAIVIN